MFVIYQKINVELRFKKIEKFQDSDLVLRFKRFID